MSEHRILITGANSGLGYAICCRLIDEYLATRQSTQKLHLIFTTRDQRKSDDTLSRLQQHVSKTISSVYGADEAHASIRDLQTARIKLEGELVDLCSLRTVKGLAQRLIARDLHLDVVILNAGIGGWSGLNWFLATWHICTRLLEATTLPAFKLGYTGRMTQAQLPASSGPDKSISKGSEEPPLGETFAANVFGHYMLVHRLASVLTSPADRPASRVIWVSSIEALAHRFDINDLQSLTNSASYESSKRLTDLLVLTSESPAVQKSLDTYLPLHKTMPSPAVRARMYVAHPGVVMTSISGISPWLFWGYMMALYLARWIGSPWHPIGAYSGAVSTCWLALAAAETLDDLEGRGAAADKRGPGREVGEYEVREAQLEGGKGKWGAATDRMGNERVVRSEVQGWGWGGVPGEVPDGLWKIATMRGRELPVTKTEVEKFTELGARCWREMERLRVEWEKVLGD